MEQKNKEYEEFFKKQEEYIRQNYNSIKELYGNDYIAIKSCQVIDHDPDDIALATRIEESHRNEPILISNLEEILNPIEDEFPNIIEEF